VGLRWLNETGLKGPVRNWAWARYTGLRLDKARLRGQCETRLGPDKLGLGAKQS